MNCQRGVKKKAQHTLLISSGETLAGGRGRKPDYGDNGWL